jgi:signal transduction histidine kinase
VNNAARYTPPDRAIRVSCAERSGSVELRVRDEGEGIDQQALPHIFEPFVQAKRVTGEGLGLGLSVVSRLVTLHGGSITAASAAWGGAASS